MKIEMAQSLLRSWLRHVRCCEFAELNWKPSPEWLPKSKEIPQLFYSAKDLWPEAFGSNSYEQLLRQAEVDVLGLSYHDNHLYFVDVAFHLGGLNYGDKDRTTKRVYKKLMRSALIAKRYFPGQTAKVLFVSPFTNPAVIQSLDEAKEKLKTLVENDPDIDFQFVLAQSEFREEFVEPLLSLGSSVADTSELFLRGWQLISPFIDTQKQRHDTLKVMVSDSPVKQSKPTADINRKDLLLTALYLAKFGHLNQLGFGNQSNTIQACADKLGCSANSLKGFRDRFDRYVESPRVGWDLPLSEDMNQILVEYDKLAEVELRTKLPE